MGRRKSDASRLKEKRGNGIKVDYRPWLKPHEQPLDSLASRHRGWINNRMHCNLSKLERGYFMLVQWEYERVVDIREQYPLLPLEETIQIAEQLRIKHPPLNAPKGNETVMSTDFVITLKKGNEKINIARTVKPKSKLTKRVKQKFMIEQEYWRRRGVDWGVVTDAELNPVMIANMEFLFPFYFWDERDDLGKETLIIYINNYKELLSANNFDVIKTSNEFDKVNGWVEGESLSFFKYLITKKIINVDMKRRITDFYKKDYKIWF